MLQTAISDITSARKEGRKGLTGVWLAIVFILSMLLVLSRRPQDLLHAQFYAEDGKRWFAQAYNVGWIHSLMLPDSGYMQLLPRLPVGIALLLPLRWAPLILNLAGATVQVFPALLLLSPLCERWGCFRVRATMASFYLAEPNALEIHVNITNAQWHFALIELLLLFAPTPRTWVGKLAIFLVFLVGAFSGPFGVALLPVMALYWYVRHDSWTLVLAGVVAIGTLVQVHTFRSGATFNPAYDSFQPTRIDAERLPLGASSPLFVQIVGDDLVLDSVVGYGGLQSMRHVPVACSIVFCLLGVFIMFFAIRCGPLEYRLLGIFSLILFAASLKSPVIFGDGTRWQLLLADSGMRYFFLPSLVLLWGLVYCAWAAPSHGLKALAGVMLALTTLEVARHWEYPRLQDMHYASEVRRVEQAPRGEVVHLPIVPSPWNMTLIKH